MSTLHITVGIPGSGKTTWARQWAAEDPGNRLRLNRDDIRLSLNLKHGDNEMRVTEVQHATLRSWLKAGIDVVVDDTNLVPKFAKELLKIATSEGAEVVWHEEFLKVDARTCIDRDRNREAKVGQDVILKMAERAKQWKRPTLSQAPDLSGFKPYTGTPGKPKVFLVDIDGTIASNGPLDRSAPHRSYYDWKAVGGDSPVKSVINMVRTLAAGGLKPIYVSGRDAVCEPETYGWIARHVYFRVPSRLSSDIALFMRPEGDNRKDSIVKLEIFDRFIRDNYDVQFCIDDRNQVVDAYRSIGLTVFQCADGNF